MIRLPPRSTRTDTLFPFTTLFRSAPAATYARAVTPDANWFSSPDDALTRLGATGYLADTATATTAYLAGALGKPLLIEGPAGVGKTELAKAVTTATTSELTRLPCYEGPHAPRPLYAWNYEKQLLPHQAPGPEQQRKEPT